MSSTGFLSVFAINRLSIELKLSMLQMVLVTDFPVLILPVGVECGVIFMQSVVLSIYIQNKM